MSGWIAVDLDGTLAHYDRWRGVTHIGRPIAPMVARVKEWLAAGREVRVFTARVSVPQDGYSIERIADVVKLWCLAEIGVELPVVCSKDYGMLELWDDRCVRVVTNTGEPCCSPAKENL